MAGETEEQGAGFLQSLGQLVCHALLQVDSGEIGEESDEERRVGETVHANTESLLVVDTSLRARAETCRIEQNQQNLKLNRIFPSGLNALSHQIRVL